MLLYRSFGLLFLIVAALIVAQRKGDQLPIALGSAGLILLLDLPLRWLGNKVPWREYDVDFWAISPYRGSHAAFIPIWLFGLAALGLGAACLFVPGFQDILEKRPGDRVDRVVENAQPVVPRPPDPPPPKLPFEIREGHPFNGRAFHYTIRNDTGFDLEAVDMEFRFRSKTTPEKSISFTTERFPAKDTRLRQFFVYGGDDADWIHARIRGKNKDNVEFTGEREWQRSK